MKIYRVRQKEMFGNQRKECAFFTSAKSAVEYINPTLTLTANGVGAKITNGFTIFLK